jgi:hypothetical protein
MDWDNSAAQRDNANGFWNRMLGYIRGKNRSLRVPKGELNA